MIDTDAPDVEAGTVELGAGSVQKKPAVRPAGRHPDRVRALLDRAAGPHRSA
jgi:hypothetical protein